MSTAPKLTIALFPPKQSGKRYTHTGSLSITVEQAAQLADWLVSQPGEHDDYHDGPVIRLVAFMYENTSKAGNDYQTVRLVDPGTFGQPQDEEAPF